MDMRRDWREPLDRARRLYHRGLVWAEAGETARAERCYVQAAKRYARMAQQGDAEAQCWLGWLYQYGEGLPRDSALAAQWYQKAAEQGHMFARGCLNVLLRRGRWEQDERAQALYRRGLALEEAGKTARAAALFAQAAQLYAQAAEQGDAEAQFWLGWLYQCGEGGLPKDKSLAAQWYLEAAKQDHALALRRLNDPILYHCIPWERQEEAHRCVVQAAERGQPAAQCILAEQYEYGWGGLAEDAAQAAAWYRRAAEQGDVLAQRELAECLWTGKGVPQDGAEALLWCRRAAEGGDPDAQYWMGRHCLERPGTPPEEGEAAAWYRRAAEQDHPEAQFGLALLCERGGRLAEAAKWYRKAAGQGLAVAQYRLARMYLKGRGVPQNDREAVKWFRKAAEQEDPDACYELGRYYAHTARPNPRNRRAARRWLELAEELGHPEAGEALETLGSPVRTGAGGPNGPGGDGRG